MLSEVAQRPRSADKHDNPPLILIIGAPRSGTTWIGKIFDSHPDVLYRNEPDIVLREDRLPILCPLETLDQYRDIARVYLDQLASVSTLKSSGTLPVFSKSYQTCITAALRVGLIYGLHAADLLTRRSRWLNGISIPDFIDRRERVPPTIVIKSVSARGRARFFIEVMPNSRVIFVLRHPCAQIASVLRGVQRKKLGNLDWIGEILSTEHASRLSLTAGRFENLTLVQKLAWHWTILNQKVLDDLNHIDCSSRLMIVRYEDVVLNPDETAMKLFGFSGLLTNPITISFVKKSTTYQGPERYFSVWKNTRQGINKWRDTLSCMDEQNIVAICKNSSVGKLYF